MPRSCPRCGVAARADDRFCTECGARLATDGARPSGAEIRTARGAESRPSTSDAPEIIIEAESDRSYVQGHACLLRFRGTSAFDSACGVTFQMRLHGRGRCVEQESGDTEQFCRFQNRGDQFVFSFPFRLLVPGEVRVESLRVIVSPVERPSESRVYELPDQSLSVRTVAESRTAAPGVMIGGDIRIDLSRLEEMYGSDIRDILTLQAAPQPEERHPEPSWQAILLRGAGSEHRIACGFRGCPRPILAERSFQCGRCGLAMCRLHQDREESNCCQVCAETVRSERFEAASEGVESDAATKVVVEALGRIRHAAPSFHARIWTQLDSDSPTRDILTVARSSKGCSRIGDKFVLYAQTERDGYLSLIDIGASGNVFLLLKDYPIRAGAPVRMSGPDASREWVVGGPPGVERLRAWFTMAPISLFGGVDAPVHLNEAASPQGLLARIRVAEEAVLQLAPDGWTDATAEFAVEGSG